MESEKNRFLQKAAELLPELHSVSVRPLGDWQQSRVKNGETLTLDFGDHFVGRVQFSLDCRGARMDAPLWLEIQFAERESELAEDAESYRGWISKSWIQSERIHIDVLPCTLDLPRRYAFRYIKLNILALSGRTELMLKDCSCLATSSAGELPAFSCGDPLLERIDRVACRTLHECMQTVFEDGPKRDRRLWLGDLRLQALANACTYRNYDLVKRCLYLFAGCARADGRVPACLFTEPRVEADDNVLFDYSLLFIPTLLDYAKASGDMETARELWPRACRQAEASRRFFGSDHVIRDSDNISWCFIDWILTLNKQAAAQGVYLYCLSTLTELAALLGEDASAWKTELALKRSAAHSAFWDAEKGLFVSGEARQISWASQIWMILGGVPMEDEARSLLCRLEENPDAVPMVTPYLHHYYLEALLLLGEREKAADVIRSYWGGMVSQGADTFWELYDPTNPNASPYGGTIVNSYCHAWSCTPAWFLRSGLLTDYPR